MVSLHPSKKKKCCSVQIRLPYRVHFEVPFLARSVQVDDNFLVGQTQLFQSNMGTVRPWAGVVRVEDDLGRGHGGRLVIDNLYSTKENQIRVIN